MEKSVVKYLAEFAQRLDKDYGDNIDVGRLFADADDGKLNIAEDLSWLDDFTKTVSHIQRILGNEHRHVKYVQQVVKVQTESRLDSESFADTLREPRFWKDSDKGARPEFVYMNVAEDEYAIYENRFIKMLIDEIIRYLSDSLTELSDSIGNLRAYFGSRLTAAGALRMSDEYQHAAKNADDKRVLAEEESPIVEVYERVENLLKKTLKFKNSTLYRECQGKPISGAIQPTNILTQNPVYRECYLFYKRFCTMRGHKKCLADTLFTNGVLRLLYATYHSGYRIFGKPELVRFSEGHLICAKVCLRKGSFTIEIEPLNTEEVEITAVMHRDAFSYAGESVEDMKRRYSLRVILKFVDCGTDECEKLAEAYRKEKIEQGYDDAYLAVYTRRSIGIDGIINFANKGDFGCRAAEDFVRSLTIQLEGAHKMFGKRCPVCGTKRADTGESIFSCIDCGSTWSLVQDAGVEKVWVKRIRH